ncbi:CsbD family protein [Rhodococcus sp. RS1C4]|uniref:CsbD family protein n=1 Tax=Nocardiaceae TaxID=85025 RepID=UPI00037FCB5F|nr:MULTISPECIES: CsbD family protein [Rhodococcus]OZC45892.1 CsbD family protein [Rhodococcus sp. 06-621-2]OZC48492.1 CsbD family protein [Rhodococcus sp. RS1C4]OZC85330.1 CsbD family protein [Rhodococcus sp. 06-418-1B]OZD12670.1 CsbD family protein [Rhodococcus sp. 06-156-4C]OZD24290.1 CsbD family protein [Rhodococcus sp. 06-156-3C]
MSDFIDKAQHKADELAGDAKERIGNATGDDELRGSGAAQKAKGNAHQLADTVSDGAEELGDKASEVADKAADVVSDAADSATKAASSLADTAASTAADAKASVTDLADNAASKVREVDVDSVVDTATSPRTVAVVAAVIGAGTIAFVIARRNRRQRQLKAAPTRAVRALARSIESKSLFDR